MALASPQRRQMGPRERPFGPPDPVTALKQALADAGTRPEEVDYLNAHGTSTLMNDRSECAAVRAVFGPHVGQLAVSSTKSLMGHLLAAAGAGGWPGAVRGCLGCH